MINSIYKSLLIGFLALCQTACHFFSSPTSYPVPQTLETARRAVVNRDIKTARILFDEYLKNNPENVFGWREYQKTFTNNDIEIFQKRVTEICPDSIQIYLNLRQKIQTKHKISHNVRPWYHLDLAQNALEKENYDEAQKYLRQSEKDLAGYPEWHLLSARLALLQVNWKKALKHSQRASQLNPADITPYFYEAADQLIQGNYPEVLHLFRKIRILFPKYAMDSDERYGYLFAFWRETIDLEREGLYRNLLQLTQEALTVFPNHAFFLTYKAKALRELGQLEQEKKALELSYAQDPYRLNTIIAYRRLLLREGKYQQAFSAWQKAVPEDLLYHRQNPLAGIFRRMRKAFDAVDKKKPQTLMALAHALEKSGWEEEAIIIYRQVSSPEAKKHIVRLKKHLDFLKDVRELIYDQYQKSTYNIVELISRINFLANKRGIHLRTRAGQELYSYFIAVREIDPFDPLPGTLGAYLAQYNKFLDLGNNYGYIEARLMNRISLCKYRRKIWGNMTEYRVMIGDETRIDTYIGFHSGSSKVAGRAFLSGKGFYIALDTIRPNILYLQKIRQKLLKPKAIVAKKKQNGYIPYHRGVGDALLKRSIEKTLDINSFTQKQLYQALLFRQIDAVHNHELGHIVDFPCFLPVMTHLPQIFTMLWQQGFSPQNIQARFETAAESFGLTYSAYPYFYLYQEMERLDVAFEGIFSWVPWAWYGRLPQEDPYYNGALTIFENLIEFSGDKEKTIANLPDYSPSIIKKLCEKLCHNLEIDRYCSEQK